MAIKQELSLYDFRTQFHRSDRGEQFTYDGLTALYEYLEELSNDIGEDIELDVIGLCCDYWEDTPDEILSSYDLDSIEELRDNTTVIEVSNGNIIIQSY